MTNFEKIKKMTIEELAKVITEYSYCKSDCEWENGCEHPTECSKKWLLEESKNDD